MIRIVDEVDGLLLDEAWALYEAAFTELNTLAVQRHLMYRPEFDQVAADKRVQKYLHYDRRERLDGLATLTNDLESMPLISPAYFARRWPAECEARRVFYCGFVAVRRGGRGMPNGVAFAALTRAMWAAAAGSPVVIDVCAHNQRRGMPGAVGAILDRAAGPVDLERLDTQTYLAFRAQA